MDERLAYNIMMTMTTTVAAWFVHPWLVFGVASFWAANFYYALYIEPLRHPPEPEAVLTEEQKMAAGFTTMITRESDREVAWRARMEQEIAELKKAR